jgi:hypothetical protein
MSDAYGLGVLYVFAGEMHICRGFAYGLWVLILICLMPSDAYNGL